MLGFIVWYPYSYFFVLWIDCISLNLINRNYFDSDLNIIPIDHQFKLLFMNKKEKMFIEPGDILSERICGLLASIDIF